MRSFQPKPKRKVLTPLPDDLRRFLADVFDKIIRHDFEALTWSDDLLQTDFVYGGRNEENGDEWGFTYFPLVNHRQTWEFNFTLGQLEEIAAGRLDSVELFECTDPTCGNRFAIEEVGCFHCDFE